MFDIMGQLAAMLAQNPALGADLDKLGIPAPAKLGGPPTDPSGYGIGPFMDPMNNDPGAPAGSPTGSMVPTGGDVNPAPAAITPTQQQALSLAALQGVKAPAPVQPIMTGGVTGGVKPPEVQMKVGGAQAPAIQALQAALMGGGKDPLRVPTLGSLIGRR